MINTYDGWDAPFPDELKRLRLAGKATTILQQACSHLSVVCEPEEASHAITVPLTGDFIQLVNSTFDDLDEEECAADMPAHILAEMANVPAHILAERKELSVISPEHRWRILEWLNELGYREITLEASALAELNRLLDAGLFQLLGHEMAGESITEISLDCAAQSNSPAILLSFQIPADMPRNYDSYRMTSLSELLDHHDTRLQKRLWEEDQPGCMAECGHELAIMEKIAQHPFLESEKGFQIPVVVRYKVKGKAYKLKTTSIFYKNNFIYFLKKAVNMIKAAEAGGNVECGFKKHIYDLRAKMGCL